MTTTSNHGQGRRRGRTVIALFTTVAALAGGEQALTPSPAAAVTQEGNECSDSTWNFVSCEEANEGGGYGGGSGGVDEEVTIEDEPDDEVLIEDEADFPVEESADGQVTIRDETPFEAYEREVVEVAMDFQKIESREEHAVGERQAKREAEEVTIKDEDLHEMFEREMEEVWSNRRRAVKAAEEEARRRLQEQERRQTKRKPRLSRSGGAGSQDAERRSGRGAHRTSPGRDSAPQAHW